ncbi:MAG: deoxyribose-phosphate aldolase [Oscillospiraceae bacterium]|nr:deoxyribose-phosphate aldolase [Oscillospiraceae bacterium]
MDNSEIFSRIDHTLLKAAAAWDEIDTLCREAIHFQTASVCVPPSYIKRISQSFPEINICTVIGFPLGYTVTEAKLLETAAAIQDGANELDMAVNLGDVKNRDFDRVTADIRAVKQLCGSLILKVIIETCYLTREEKITLCSCVTEAGADYIKTSTGFGTAGAAMEDILLFKEHIGPNIKIKAAGGIRTRQDMVDFIRAGCDRIGTSSAVKILSGKPGEGY